jgi:hypothetical protein
MACGQEIVTVPDDRASWGSVHSIVDEIYEAARELDHMYYEQTERGFGVLEEGQASRLMDIYEVQELQNPLSYECRSDGLGLKYESIHRFRRLDG